MFALYDPQKHREPVGYAAYLKDFEKRYDKGVPEAVVA